VVFAVDELDEVSYSCAVAVLIVIPVYIDHTQFTFNLFKAGLLRRV